MKATGIVRRIDELGRVVIPKEIRKTYKIREGDPLEIFTGADSELILRKYSPMDEVRETANAFCEALHETSGKAALITDKDAVLAAVGAPKKDYIDKPIDDLILKMIEERRTVAAYKPADAFAILAGDPSEYTSVAVTPVLSDGELFGAALLFTRDNREPLTESDVKMLRVCAASLAKLV